MLNLNMIGNEHVQKEVFSSITFPIKLTKEQERTLNSWMYWTRQVTNACLYQRELYKGRVDKFSQQYERKYICAAFPEVKAIPQVVVEAAIDDVDLSFQRFFAKLGGYPRYKRFGEQNLRFRQIDSFKAITILNGKTMFIKFPKIGNIRVKYHTFPGGDWKSLTISQKNGKWFVSIARKLEREFYSPPASESIGIDRGVVHTAVTSKPVNGTHFHDMPNVDDLENRKIILQKRLSNQKKGSVRREKTKQALAKISNKIANIKKDFNHNLSRSIVDNFGTIVVEDLNIKGMTKSAKGTIEEPGTNVAAKSGLNKAILKNNWGQLHSMLDYKSKWRDTETLKVNPAFTSQICSCCGTTNKENRIDQATFKCVECGHEMNADLNASINIEYLGVRREKVKQKKKKISLKKPKKAA